MEKRKTMNIEQEKMIVEPLTSLYPLKEAAIKAVIGVISSNHENDLPDTNVGEMITKQQVIDVLERVKRTANDILYDGPVLMSYNDVLDSIINIVNLLPAEPQIIHCKDCKYFKQVFAPNDNDGLCGHWHSKCDARTSRKGYCSHAERKQNDTERC